MGTCACIESLQKKSTTSYIDITSKIPNPQNHESSNNTNMLEPPPKHITPHHKDSSKHSFPRFTKQSTNPSSVDLSISHIKQSSCNEYKNYPNSNHQEINITLIGNSQTGKSSFVIKYVDKFFEKHYIPSIHIEHYNKKVKHNNDDDEYLLNFQIIPGDNEYVFDYKNILYRNDFIFLFYDTSVHGSFNECTKILKSKIGLYEKIYNGNIKNIIFVGSKVDVLPRKEPLSKIQVYCLENNYKFFEISAKHMIGFKDLIANVINSHNELIIMD